MNKILEEYMFKKYKKIYYRIVNKEVMQFIGVIYISGSWWLKYTCLFMHVDRLDMYLDPVLGGLVEFDINSLIGKDEKCFRTKEEAFNYLSSEHLDKLNEIKCLKDYIKMCNEGLITSSGFADSPSINDYLYLKDYENAEKMILKDIENYDNLIAFTIVEPIISQDDKCYESCDISEADKNEKLTLLSEIKNKKDFSEKYDKIYSENITFLNEKLKYKV
jgi:hypothetical protein